MKLLTEAVGKFVCGLILVGLLLFLPAGTLRYANAWLLLGLLFIPILLAGVVLFCKNPEFLKKRLDAKEKQATQKGVVAFAGLMFVAGFVVAGLDARFDWSDVPDWVIFLASVLFLGAYGLYVRVMKENAYLSRTIRVEEGQTVVDTGLYAIVRHPMYMATVLLFLMMPLILGSWYALIAFGFYPAAIAVRLKNEEKILVKELPGYAEYQKKVRFRLIPFVW